MAPPIGPQVEAPRCLENQGRFTTAIGISAGGISAAQLSSLKNRVIAVQSTFQALSNNPQDAQLLASLNGEQISGDVLTATIWTWFAAAERHNELNRDHAGIIERPALSYGLYHAVANPIATWGIVRKVTFPGVNIDVGHVRNLTWSKDNSEQRWISYNRLRGQHMSSLEHSIPERFLSDPRFCNVRGGTISATLPACAQGMSAVKALAMASEAGQKVFTITANIYANNPNIVDARLASHSVSTKARVQQALDAGYEVAIHESPLYLGGWSGAGFSLIDPSNGAGGYLIEGGTNGGVLEFIDNLQKYLLTPHATGFSYGAGFKAFADSFANFAGVFSFVVDILSFMDKCSGDELVAAILMWTLFTIMMLLITLLITLIFAPIFMTMLLVSIGANLMADFWLKPVVLDRACGGST